MVAAVVLLIAAYAVYRAEKAINHGWPNLTWLVGGVATLTAGGGGALGRWQGGLLALPNLAGKILGFLTNLVTSLVDATGRGPIQTAIIDVAPAVPPLVLGLLGSLALWHTVKVLLPQGKSAVAASGFSLMIAFAMPLLLPYFGDFWHQAIRDLPAAWSAVFHQIHTAAA